MKLTLSFSLLLAVATGLVSAHGVLEQVTVGGKVYAAPPMKVSGNSAPSVIRQVRDNGPVAGGASALTSVFMACGNDAAPASLEADAMPGDLIDFKWSNSWPHLVGPMLTYMANCGQTCTNFDSIQAKWFKIDQKAFKQDTTEWVQKDIAAGLPDKVVIPQNLKAGHYLIRHEIIANHNIPVEYYPMCAQLNVGGSGTGVPLSDELVSFPGAYSGQEQGLNTNGYQVRRRLAEYQFPGPKLSTLGGTAAPSSGEHAPVSPSDGSGLCNGYHARRAEYQFPGPKLSTLGGTSAPSSGESTPPTADCHGKTKRMLVRRSAPASQGHASRHPGH